MRGKNRICEFSSIKNFYILFLRRVQTKIRRVEQRKGNSLFRISRAREEELLIRCSALCARRIEAHTRGLSEFESPAKYIYFGREWLKTLTGAQLGLHNRPIYGRMMASYDPWSARYSRNIANDGSVALEIQDVIIRKLFLWSECPIILLVGHQILVFNVQCGQWWIVWNRIRSYLKRRKLSIDQFQSKF